MITNNEIIFRLVLATICGGLIGIEREYHNKAGGFRTHILVSAGSALIMSISMYGFLGGDPARLASQVVSGIGFLGAGTIMREKSNVKGLTTAASIWVTAGIGLAFGNGFYLGGAITTIIVLFSLMALGFFEHRLLSKKYNIIEVTCKERTGLIGEIGSLMGNNDITIKDIKFNDRQISEDGEVINFALSVKTPVNIDREELRGKIEKIKGIIEVNMYNLG
ncbi:MgtC/SapB family protein [Paramaledivibacter caminithermalis]|jgi:putative Mg2+ transporter-C (MgtC) family protein|uniref:Putative Mg2+ transporter-C (MgtC) family protein n=1 Tax=Paramaledivibacter caminithermalis (strain DSM 15212 / CIP 107654 / DViRD3) TaxID=1121301 RepID=A0A1M6K318_PARC5|nr:MgtC/SapB family protein [Paramaledivibacter caminithermalis]SHJ53212.1 putative Mg2+ transporter-C (MgtC) family protein [Paramaledivibacter caminithermalis DSM 15212]